MAEFYLLTKIAQGVDNAPLTAPPGRMNLTTRMHKGWRAPPGCQQSTQNFRLTRQMPITQAQVEIEVRETVLNKSLKGKNVGGVLVVKHIVKERDMIGRTSSIKQAVYLLAQFSVTNDANPPHLVATNPRYLNRLRDTGNAR
jgi:hypothetical protein